ncbi:MULTISPECIES: GspH/FimT family pseudopilin [Chromohalobacter]|uniref:Type II secretion system protein H n=1 Tax=Chromohalobacter moromii TaxID=2860329 RepID=A0A9X3B5D6_9GAMM|nr:GspH/FimT family pseudopilin [Chromohalobacter moromii]MCT8470082.1 GspH/FimT family pseudopilin [Chromohalobacter canadensis]MCT8473137.1 GspH/FimT family pseudopilin [Chromohalobacter canadensis]MCT8500529.1 GspH/FimT family pseudopilin [Chromohalobacter canadensis]MCT8506849.1 GspH/FimT family pseudopilin [Chromohalobacter moromii]
MPHRAYRLRHVSHSRGFSLLELLIVLVIFAIMASIAVPSFQSLRQQQQLTDASNELVAALRLARGEAIMREDEVTLSPATGKDWAQGWRIADEDKNTVVVHEPLPSQLSVGGENAQSPDKVTFDELGYPGGGTKWRLRHAARPGVVRWVCMSRVGRAYVAESDKGCDS